MECSLTTGGGPRTETGYIGEIAALSAGLGAPQCGRGVRTAPPATTTQISGRK